MTVLYNGAHFARTRWLDIGQHWHCHHHTSSLETSSQCLLNLFDRWAVMNSVSLSFNVCLSLRLQCCLYWSNPAFTDLLQITQLLGSYFGSNGQVLYRIGMSRSLCVNKQAWPCSELSTGQPFLSCPVLPSCNCLFWWGQDRTRQQDHPVPCSALMRILRRG